MKHLNTIFLTLTLLYLSCHYQTMRLTDFQVHGIDVSHYQSHIDWGKVAAQDVHFAFIKATEGEALKDSLFQENWQLTKENNVIRGAYHFFHPTLSVDLQIQNFISSVHLEAGDLPPVLDIEVLNGVSSEVARWGARKWVTAIEKHYGIQPIIYTNLKFYNQHLAGHFDDYPLWIARYNHQQPELNDQRAWYFWQYGDRGRLEGIDGDVDFNVFYGPLPAMQTLTVPVEAQLTSVQAEDLVML